MILCSCKALSDKVIRQLLEQGKCKNLRDLMNACSLGTECGCCIEQAKELIRETNKE
jgi:bacterioferritin-associated ferredoxin